jgi:energy-coupling factor transport system permease protein
MILLANLITWTTPPLSITDAIEHMLKPFQRVKVPVQEMALMISLSIRFIPILFSESVRIQKAQMSRGVLVQGPLWNRAKHAIPVVIPLFLSAFRRAHELALAMDARCYTIGCRRTPYGRLRWKGSDTIFTLGAWIGGLALVWLDRGNG